MTVRELKTEREHHLDATDKILKLAEQGNRPLTPSEQTTCDTHMKAVGELNRKIEAANPKSIAEVRYLVDDQIKKHGIQLTRDNFGEGSITPILSSRFSRDYQEGFYSWLGRKGAMSAALYEGANNFGGYAVPVTVDQQIVPLAPQDSAVRRIATVIPTKSDIKVPQITVRTPVSAVAETTSFPTASPTLGQFTLSAFLAGVEVPITMEFAQDVVLFETFVLDDVLSAFLEYEESLFISGTGSGQPQGLLGNVGSGITDEPDGNGNLVSIQGTLDILGTLKETYHAGASWLMQRATSLIIRKAQVGTNLYENVWRRENGVDLLHGYPVAYSSQMPTAARGATPILFGDFRKGYVIGDRGGSALFVKPLTQMIITAGEINMMFYRRTDGRVRRSEAITSYQISAS
jgi:HK97 family phage major capsid protein